MLAKARISFRGARITFVPLEYLMVVAPQSRPSYLLQHLSALQHEHPINNPSLGKISVAKCLSDVTSGADYCVLSYDLLYDCERLLLGDEKTV
jgi:hypothetical protein